MDPKSLPLELLKRPIAYHALMAKAFESVPLAVMVSQLYYWTSRCDDPNGWVYKSAEDMYDETGVTRRMQDTARAKGIELGIMQAEVRGTPPVMHYRLEMSRILEVLQECLNKTVTTTLFPVKPAGESTPGQKARAFFEDEEVRARYVETIKAHPAFANHSEELERQIRKFVDYWTEPSKSGHKVRWEMQSTFDVQRRITTWLNNVSKFGGSKGSKGRQGLTV